MVQGMMDRSEIEFYEEWDRHDDPSINVIDEERPTNGQISSYLSLIGIRKKANKSFR